MYILIDRLEEPDSAERLVADEVITRLLGFYRRNPLYLNGPDISGEVVLPLSVRLGVAVRIVEIEELQKKRPIEDGFDDEISAAVAYWESTGLFDAANLRPEDSWCQNFILEPVRLGYDAVRP